MTIAKQLKHDFTTGYLRLYDSNGNETYFETSVGDWFNRKYDSNNNLIYRENSDGDWSKYEYDSNGNYSSYASSNGYWLKNEHDSNGKVIYSETSEGIIVDYRPKPNCNGKTVTVDGVEYELKMKH